MISNNSPNKGPVFVPGKKKKKNSNPLIIVLIIAIMVVSIFIKSNSSSQSKPDPVDPSKSGTSTTEPSTPDDPQETKTGMDLLVTIDDNYTYNWEDTISSEQEFVNAAGYLRRNGFSDGEFKLSKTLFSAKKLPRLAALAGMESYGYSYDADTCKVSFTNIVWSKSSVLDCEDITDLKNALLLMSELEIYDFTLVMSDSLYNRMSVGDFALLVATMKDQGVYRYDSIGANEDAHSITLTGVKNSLGEPILETMEQVHSYMSKKTEAGQTDILLKCSTDIFNYLSGSEGGLRRAVELMDAYGAMQGSHYTLDHSSKIIQYEMNYYAGYKIILAWRSGDLSSLTSREQKTYEKALKLASELKCSSPAETVYAIHDKLCKNVYYKIDKNSDEDDQAIGALLNGYANCDGYSDAFYLIGTLAGLEIRYQHGNTYDAEITSDADTTHVWNLVNINDNWYNVDVTWDDIDSNHVCVYTYALIGSDRMGITHYWVDETNVSIAEKTDTSLRPEYEYYVNSEDEMNDAAKSAAKLNPDTIIFVFLDDMKDRREKVFDYLRQYRKYGSLDWFWEEDTGVLTVFVR